MIKNLLSLFGLMTYDDHLEYVDHLHATNAKLYKTNHDQSAHIIALQTLLEKRG